MSHNVVRCMTTRTTYELLRALFDNKNLTKSWRWLKPWMNSRGWQKNFFLENFWTTHMNIFNISKWCWVWRKYLIKWSKIGYFAWPYNHICAKKEPVCTRPPATMSRLFLIPQESRGGHVISRIKLVWPKLYWAWHSLAPACLFLLWKTLTITIPLE